MSQFNVKINNERTCNSFGGAYAHPCFVILDDISEEKKLEIRKKLIFYFIKQGINTNSLFMGCCKSKNFDNTLFMETIPENCPFISDIGEIQTNMLYQGCGTIVTFRNVKVTL